MKKALRLSGISLLFVAACLLSPLFARGAQWEQIGYGTLEDAARFDVYVDTDSIIVVGDKIRFWQGHVFYTEQSLPSGGVYMRVSIQRVVDCAYSGDSNIQAIFYGREDTVIHNYKDNIHLEPVGPDTIRQGVRQFVCEYGNN